MTAEAPGREPIALGIYEVEGWTHPVVAGSFPADLAAASGGDVDIVARDAAGHEVARNSAVLGSDG